MRALSAFVLLCFFAGGAHAQLHRPNVHADLGGAATGGGDFANDGGFFGRLGFAVPVSEIAFQLDGSAFAHAVTTPCVASSGRHCAPDFPNVASLTADMVIQLTDPDERHPITALIGAGPFRIWNSNILANTSFGAEAGAEMLLWAHARNSLTVGARIEYVSHTDFGSFWILPITAGFRFW